MAENSVEVIEHKKVERWLQELITSNRTVHVGIVADPAMSGPDSSAASKKRRDAPDAGSLLKVAAVHEYGYEPKNIPERSYLRSTFNENNEKLFQVFKKALKMQGETYGASEAEQVKVFSIVGQWMADKVKAKFTSNSWEALKDPFRGGKNKRGNAKPLIDTGQLRASISYQVVKGDAK